MNGESKQKLREAVTLMTPAPRYLGVPRLPDPVQPAGWQRAAALAFACLLMLALGGMLLYIRNATSLKPPTAATPAASPAPTPPKARPSPSSGVTPPAVVPLRARQPGRQHRPSRAASPPSWRWPSILSAPTPDTR